MIKKINESFDKQLKETNKEKVNLVLESLAELNEEEHNEEVIKSELMVGPTKYVIEVYPEAENGYVAHWEDDTDNGFGYNNKGWVNFDEKAKFFAFKEKGYAEPEDYISVISVYDRPLKADIKNKIINKVLQIRGQNEHPEEIEEACNKENKEIKEEALKEDNSTKSLNKFVKVKFECPECGKIYVRDFDKDYFEDEEDLNFTFDNSYDECPKCGCEDAKPIEQEIIDEALKEEYDGDYHYTYQPVPDGPEFGTFEEAMEEVENNENYTSITMYRYKYDPETKWEDDIPNTSEDVWTREEGIIADWLTENCKTIKEELDENTKKEVEVELEDILKRNPEKHGFDADTEEVKYYVVKLLKDKGYKTETSGNNNYKPNKYHVEYWREEKIEESLEDNKHYIDIIDEYIVIPDPENRYPFIDDIEEQLVELVEEGIISEEDRKYISDNWDNLVNDTKLKNWPEIKE